MKEVQAGCVVSYLSTWTSGSFQSSRGHLLATIPHAEIMQGEQSSSEERCHWPEQPVLVSVLPRAVVMIGSSCGLVSGLDEGSSWPAKYQPTPVNPLVKPTHDVLFSSYITFCWWAQATWCWAPKIRNCFLSHANLKACGIPIVHEWEGPCYSIWTQAYVQWNG